MMLMDLQWQGLEYRMINNVVPAIKMVVDNWSEIKAVTIAVAAGIAARFGPVSSVATYQLGQTAIFAYVHKLGYLVLLELLEQLPAFWLYLEGQRV